MVKGNPEATLLEIYRRLLARYGPQHWWPAEAPFEVIVGAILTQSAAWTNVEKAIANLKDKGVLSPAKLRQIGQLELAELIYSCGYYNVKAAKLKAFVEWFGREYGDSLTKMSASETGHLRGKLLAIYGVGPETADSIILYALNQPVFVIDAYTRRIVSRLGLLPEGRLYQDYQALFMHNLPAETPLFNEYHALLVALAKDACRKQPISPTCCLRDLCPAAKAQSP
jgi:endonuclease-3 related protein